MDTVQHGSWDQRLAGIERMWNHLLLLLLIASLIAHFVVGDDGVCPIVAMHNQLSEVSPKDHTPSAQDEPNLRIEEGVAYTLPQGALISVGIAFLILGVGMLIFGVHLKQSFSAAVLVGGMAIAAEEVTARAWLVGSRRDSLGISVVTTRGDTELNSFTFDVACTGSLFTILVAVWAGLSLVASGGFKRAALLFEGGVFAVMSVRLIADFYPPLLETYPADDQAGHFFLGYPIVPFWATAIFATSESFLRSS